MEGGGGKAIIFASRLITMGLDPGAPPAIWDGVICPGVSEPPAGVGAAPGPAIPAVGVSALPDKAIATMLEGYCRGKFNPFC